MRAELCELWDDFACAEQAYTAALLRRPRSGWLNGRVGAFYLPTNPVRAGQSWVNAAKYYEAAVDLRPQDPWAHERLAYVLLNRGTAGRGGRALCACPCLDLSRLSAGAPVLWPGACARTGRCRRCEAEPNWV